MPVCAFRYGDMELHIRVGIGWLRLVGSLKLYLSFAKEPYKRDQKSLIKETICCRDMELKMRVDILLSTSSSSCLLEFLPVSNPGLAVRLSASCSQEHLRQEDRRAQTSAQENTDMHTGKHRYAHRKTQIGALGALESICDRKTQTSAQANTDKHTGKQRLELLVLSKTRGASQTVFSCARVCVFPSSPVSSYHCPPVPLSVSSPPVCVFL